MRRYLIGLLTCLLVSSSTLFAQKGSFSGSFQTNNNFYQRDTAIGAANTPQYDNQLSGTDAWLNLNYSNWGFDLGLRFDLFLNSNLRNPQQSYTAQGIGNWFIRKKIKQLDITAGYLYDEIGSGIIFRAYEERPLAIDNALVGARLIYDITPDWKAKVMTGKQRNFFDLYEPVIKAASIEGFWTPSDTSKIQLVPGIGAVNRTLDDQSMSLVVSNIESQPPTERFVPDYNTYAFTLYNTLNYDKFSWYIEGAYKTAEAINVPNVGLENRSGSVLYTSLSYATKGLGIIAQAKRTENFDLRTSPNETLNLGLINFLPPMARENTYTLTARYNANTQLLSEQAFQIEVNYSPSRKQSYMFNFANVTDLDGLLLYREAIGEATFKGKRNKWRSIIGLQFQNYNQEVYEQKPGVPLLETIIPYTEFIYKINRKNSFRIEAQYMVTEQDFGQWLYLLGEYNISPHWSFSLADMINTVPKKSDKVQHYPVVFIAYSRDAHRVTLSYVKQVEGIVCTGGVCRFEPAFSGAKFTVSSKF